MYTRTQIVSLMFSDIAGYSSLQSNQLIASAKKLIDDYTRLFLNEKNHFYFNTWGDALLVCSYDPVDAAEIAIDLRDRFKTANWKRIGFDNRLAIRVALHAQKIDLHLDNNVVKDISGKNVNAAARIEPIVEPNCVWCSKSFYDLLFDEQNCGFIGKYLGKKNLAKNFGEMEIYELYREDEATGENVQDSIPTFVLPRVKKTATEKEKACFLKNAYEAIKIYFRQAMEKLNSIDSDIVAEFNEVDSSSFRAQVFVQGRSKASCCIWIENSELESAIYYSEDYSNYKSGYNESLSVTHDGYNFYLAPLMYSFSFSYHGVVSNQLSQEEAAKYYFDRFSSNLEQ